ncbi:glycoside hydrolase [Hyaloscypha variabilis]
MKITVYALAFAATLSRANASKKGFNYLHQHARLRALRCDTLVSAFPAAVLTGRKILVGVWTEDNTHYGAEKQALLTAVETHGFDCRVAVSVGSEDLYQGDTTTSTLAQQIYDVRGMLSTVSGYNTSIQVGHVDTWTAVIEACDFVGTDGYPYWWNTEANGIDEACNLFCESIQEVKDAVSSVNSVADVWVTETGWPTTGASENEVVANVANAQKYRDTVACAAFEQIDTFWYALQDFNASASFGVVDASFNALCDLTCSHSCEP